MKRERERREKERKKRKNNRAGIASLHIVTKLYRHI